MQMSTGSLNDYRYLRQVVLGHSRNVLDPSCDYLFDARLSRLLRNHGMSRVDELVRVLRLHKDAVLERAVAEAMTINETSFFRDHWPFEYLRTDLLPEMIERRRAVRTLRFWSAGCSTGQEALSLAMVLREYFPQIAHWNIRVEGTDICTEAVARARGTLPPHRDEPRSSRPNAGAVFHARRRTLGSKAGDPDHVPFPAGDSVHNAASLP